MSESRLTGREVSEALARAPWKRFVAIGDSITEGYGMDPVEGVEHLPWAERVARALREGQPDLLFVNLARRNLMAAQIREQQLERALALDPDLVTITAGPNDLLDPEFGRERIERDLDVLIAPLAETEATLVMFTYMNITETGLFPPDGATWLRRRMETLHDATRVVAERYGALLFDLWSRPETGNPGFFSADLQHANARGQLYVAEFTTEHLARHVLETEGAVATAAPAQAGGE